jgi:hypothetical protein
MVKQELWVVGSPVYARAGEGVYWEIDTTNYGGSPASVSVAAYDLKTDTDVTLTVLSGSQTVSGNVIRLPKFQSSNVGDFRIIITFTNANFAPAKPELDVYVLK